MASHPFHIVDVFTDVALAGNQLAVVHDADDLDDERCQSIAREFNLSETVFVMTPRDAVNTARIRIFTPTRELPFAGHPTVGTAMLLARLRAPEMIGGRQDLAIVLEETIGPVECVVRRTGAGVRTSFTVPKLPEEAGPPPATDILAAVLGLTNADLGFERHRPCVVSAGNPFLFIPVADLARVHSIQPDGSLWAERMGDPSWRALYCYARGGVTDGASFHARMFALNRGVVEDPATGSAVAAMSRVVAQCDSLGDGDHTLLIEQGFEMGRPSLMTLGIEIESGALVSASVGGGAVIVAEGTLL